MAALTPADLVNPKRKSGYDRVSRAGGTGKGHGGGKPWNASVNAGGVYSWRGPRRATELEAAQDYCDYVNGGNVPPSPKLKSAGHKYSPAKSGKDPEVEAALGVLRDHKAQQAGKQGYVYLIGEGTDYVKVGYSTNPEKRLAELQTGNARKLELIAKKKGTEADEKALHAKYIKDNVIQEWFTLSPSLRDEFPATLGT